MYITQDCTLYETSDYAVENNHGRGYVVFNKVNNSYVGKLFETANDARIYVDNRERTK